MWDIPARSPATTHMGQPTRINTPPQTGTGAPAAAPLPEDASRRVRGPRHQRPSLVRWTALMHLLTRLFLLGGFVCAGICVLEPKFPRVTVVILASAVAICWSIWLVAASKVGCRVCAMRMFFNKTCAKNRKAPDWLFFGPHTTLALRALFAKSVRCPYCGTPNELTSREDD